MAKFFSFDSKAAQFLSHIWDLFILNFFFLLGCLPIVTIGVSAIAAYSVALKIVQERDKGVIRAFFEAYKENLKQGIILTFALAFALAAVAADFILFENLENNPLVFAIVGFISAFFVLVHFFFVFAISARYKGTVISHLNNSRNIYFRFYGRSLLCTLLVAFEMWLFFLNGWLLLYIGVFIAPILIVTTVSAFAMKFFNLLEEENNTGESYIGGLTTVKIREAIKLNPDENK